MPTKPLERLMFAQGGLCFFCTQPLPKEEASVEHLVPSARSGSNHDDNCVACCKSMNSLLGSMSLKEKIKVVLNQKGDFRCPNGMGMVAVEIDASATVAPLPSLPLPLGGTPIGDAGPAAVLPTEVAAPPKPKNPATAPQKATASQHPKDALAAVIKNLKGRGTAKPLTVKTLTSTIKALPLNLNSQQIQAVVDQLKAQGKVVVTGTKITYKL